MILYKYRSISNTMFLLDILVNKRIFAATYDSLNDPMEGHFRYNKSKIGRDLLSDIRDIKKGLKICSLTKKPNDILMWSYYGDGHKGIAIGLKIVENDNYDITEVKYREQVAKVSSIMRAEKAAKKLLTTKLSPWEHEEEVRVLTSEDFVDIEIKELIFGKKVDSKERKLIKQFAKKLGINNTRTIKSHELKEI